MAFLSCGVLFLLQFTVTPERQLWSLTLRDELNSMTIRPTIKVTFAVFCIVNVACRMGFATTEPMPVRGDLNQFWLVFRRATLEKDWQKVKELTSFPLTVRGELDGDPIQRVGRAKFSKIFDRFLKEGVFSPNEQLEFIRNTTTIDSAVSSGDMCRIGDMIFKRTATGWRLNTLYMQSGSN
jgi:hypothetical protein